MVRCTDCPNMTIVVYHRCRLTKQQTISNKQLPELAACLAALISMSFLHYCPAAVAVRMNFILIGCGIFYPDTVANNVAVNEV